MNFSVESKEHAIRIMQSISQRPCAKPFLFPVDPINDNCIDYYEIVRKPVCITLIINKLLNADDNYSNIEGWRSDIQLIYKNTISYFGINSHMGYLAEEFLKVFEKEFRDFSTCYNSNLWLKSFAKLVQKQKMLELQMPGRLGNAYRQLFAPRPIASPQVLPSPKLDSIYNDFENVDHENEPQLQSQSEYMPICRHSEDKDIKIVEDVKPKRNRPGRPRKILNQNLTKDQETSEKVPKARKPRKPRQSKEKTNNLNGQDDETANKILPIKLNSFSQSISDEFKHQYHSYKNNEISPQDHDHNYQSSANPDKSPSSFSYNAHSNFNGDISDQKPNLNKEDNISSPIFPPSFKFDSKASHPIPPTINNDSQIAPSDDCLHCKLPPELEEKVEDMEDDVLFEVTSCFS